MIYQVGNIIFHCANMKDNQDGNVLSLRGDSPHQSAISIYSISQYPVENQEVSSAETVLIENARVEMYPLEKENVPFNLTFVMCELARNEMSCWSQIQFEGAVRFRECNLLEGLHWPSCLFRQRVELRSSKVDGEINWRGCRFLDHLLLRDCQIQESIFLDPGERSALYLEQTTAVETYAQDFRELFNDLNKGRLLKSLDDWQLHMQKRIRHVRQSTDDVNQWSPELNQQSCYRAFWLSTLRKSRFDFQALKSEWPNDVPSTASEQQSELFTFVEDSVIHYVKSITQRIRNAKSESAKFTKQEFDGFSDALVRSMMTWDTLDQNPNIFRRASLWNWSPEQEANFYTYAPLGIQKLQQYLKETLSDTSIYTSQDTPKRQLGSLATLVWLEHVMEQVVPSPGTSETFINLEPQQSMDNETYGIWRDLKNSVWLEIWNTHCKNDFALFEQHWKATQQWLTHTIRTQLGTASTNPEPSLIREFRRFLAEQKLEIGLGSPALLQRLLDILSTFELRQNNTSNKFYLELVNSRSHESGDFQFFQRLQHTFLLKKLHSCSNGSLETARELYAYFLQVLTHTIKQQQLLLPSMERLLHSTSSDFQEATARSLSKVTEWLEEELQGDESHDTINFVRQMRRAALREPDLRAWVIGKVSIEDCIIENGISMEEILSATAVKLTNSKINGHLPNDRNKSQNDISLNWEGARFWNDLAEDRYYQNYCIELRDCQVAGTVVLDAAQVQGSIHLDLSRIGGEFWFESQNRRFKKRESRKAILGMDLVFHNVTIENDIHIQGLELRWLFAKNFTLNGQLVGWKAHFRCGFFAPYATFRGLVDLQSSTFGKGTVPNEIMQNKALELLGSDGQLEQRIQFKASELNTRSNDFPFGLLYLENTSLHGGLRLLRLRSPSVYIELNRSFVANELDCRSANIALLSLTNIELKGDVRGKNLKVGRLNLSRARIDGSCELTSLSYEEMQDLLKNRQPTTSGSGSEEERHLHFQQYAHVNGFGLRLGGTLDLREVGQKQTPVSFSLKDAVLQEKLLAEDSYFDGIQMDQMSVDGEVRLDRSQIRYLQIENARLSETISLKYCKITALYSVKSRIRGLQGVGLQVFERFFLRESVVEGQCVFSSSSEASSDQATQLKGLDFSHTKFERDLIFGQGTSITSEYNPNSTPRLLLDFSGLSTEELIPQGMQETQIHGRLNCQGCRIGIFSFTGATINGAAKFQDCEFYGSQNLQGVIYNQGADFTGSKFLRKSKSPNVVDFSLSTFNGNAVFDQIVFSQSLSFHRATFNQMFSMRGAKDQTQVDVNFKKSNPETLLAQTNVSFSEVAIYGNANFTGTLFTLPYFGGASIHKVQMDKQTTMLWNKQLTELHRCKHKTLVVTVPMQTTEQTSSNNHHESNTWSDVLDSHRSLMIVACDSHRMYNIADKWKKEGSSDRIAKLMYDPFQCLRILFGLLLIAMGTNLAISYFFFPSSTPMLAQVLEAVDYAWTGVLTGNPIEINTKLPETLRWTLRFTNYAYTALSILFLNFFLVALGHRYIRD
ncbi:MAG: hypothetical protein EP343_17225 [Deltaproteobacteria bacterium]|nr:MAG: hypothetical protein EP343_17225 [Deltaproteobacteria bacterium]